MGVADKAMEKLVKAILSSVLCSAVAVVGGPVDADMTHHDACPILNADPAIWAYSSATIYFCKDAGTNTTYSSSRECLSQCPTFCQVAELARNGQCTLGGNVHPIRRLSDNSSAIRESSSNTSSIGRRGCFVPTNCLNKDCWASNTVCNFNGDAVDDSVLIPLQSAFCDDADGQGIEHSTTYSKTLRAKNGQQIYSAIRNWAPCGRYTLGVTECNWLLDPISKSWEDYGCQPRWPNTYTQGGYAWFNFKDLTGVIGVDGNAPTDFGGGGC